MSDPSYDQSLETQPANEYEGITFEYDPALEADDDQGFDPFQPADQQALQGQQQDPYAAIAELARNGQVEAAQAALAQIRGTAQPARQQAFVDPFQDPEVMAELDRLEMTDRNAYRQRFAELASLAAANRVMPTAQGSANANLVQLRVERDFPAKFGRSWNAEVQRTIGEAFNRIAAENPQLLANPNEALRVLEEVGNAKVGQLVRQGGRRQQPPIGARTVRGPASYVQGGNSGQSVAGPQGQRVVRVTQQDAAAAEKFGITPEAYAARRAGLAQGRARGGRR
jgi:hypothetical protein